MIVDNFARRDENRDSLAIIKLCEDGDLEGVASTITIMDLMYILRKYIDSEWVRNTTQMLIQTLDVESVLKSDIIAALMSDFSDFEDSVQAICAMRIKADYLKKACDYKSKI